MQIHLATNCTAHLELCTKDTSVLGFMQLYKLDYKGILTKKNGCSFGSSS